MTPEQISGLTALATIVRTIGTMPFGASFVLIMFGPWVLMYFQARAQDRRSADHAQQSAALVAALRDEYKAAVVAFERRFEAVVTMYEKNVVLVQDYSRVTDELMEHLRLNTEILTRLAERVKP